MKNIKSNQITNLGNYAKQISAKSSVFENTKILYDSYVKKIEKTDFANSLTRYEVEFNMLKSMKEAAKEGGLTKELEQIENRIKVVNEKLSEFGIKYKAD